MRRCGDEEGCHVGWSCCVPRVAMSDVSRGIIHLHLDGVVVPGTDLSRSMCCACPLQLLGLDSVEPDSRATLMPLCVPGASAMLQVRRALVESRCSSAAAMRAAESLS